MTYLEKLKILLNQIKYRRFDIGMSQLIDQKDKEKFRVELDLEVYKIQILIIQEENKCQSLTQDHTTEK